MKLIEKLEIITMHPEIYNNTNDFIFGMILMLMKFML